MREFCKLSGKECIITTSQYDAGTFEEKILISGLKDCSERFCQYKGQNGCLLKTKNRSK